jgi:hypothetical protein
MLGRRRITWVIIPEFHQANLRLLKVIHNPGEIMQFLQVVGAIKVALRRL